MFANLSDKLSITLRNLRGMGKLSEDNMNEALKAVYTALLSADVHFNVARQFIDNVKSECLGQEVIKSITPGQQVIKIIHDQLVVTFGEGTSNLSEKKPLKIMMLGLHGSGKTTSCVKLAHFLKKKGYRPALVACDVYRPAAIDQLETLAKTATFPVYSNRNIQDVSKIGQEALKWAEEQNIDAIIFDTAGRLHIDKDLIQEIVELKKIINPEEILLVADSALGQEAVNIAKHFNEAVDLTGIILTKLDGDARGGAALSMKSATGTAIKFIGTGEKIDNFEVFHPNRMAQRILGMGDVVSLVEKAQETVGKDEAAAMAKKFKKAEFSFEDFLNQIQQLKKMGSLASLASFLPGAGKMQVGPEHEKQLKRTEALILSMTKQERINPNIINGSRRLRIAKGAGCQVKDLNQLLKQFQQMRKVMKSMKGSNAKKMKAQLGNMPSMDKLASLFK